VKRCVKCGNTKSKNEFGVDTVKRDGLRSYCKPCDRIRSLENYKKNRAARIEGMKGYHLRNRACRLGQMKAWSSKNGSLKSESMHAWYLANKDWVRGQHKDYRKRNPHKVAYWTSKRRLAKMQRTPKWLTRHHLAVIEMFYETSNNFSKETGTQFHVDHIIPLQGRNVSGLHVPWNLQIIEAAVNIAKKNRILPCV
jgi:hypothetical protein